MSGFTKGPWTIHEDKGRDFGNGDIDYGGFRIDAPGIEQIAFVWRSNRRFGSEEMFGAGEAEANARLIAAAPELYEALEKIVREHDCTNPEATVRTARAALAKATGESK